MQLFISKEKFASLKGYENVHDFEDCAKKDGKRAYTKSKIDDAFELIKKHSRFVL